MKAELEQLLERRKIKPTAMIDDGTGSVKYAICNDSCEYDYPQDIHIHFY